MIAVNFAILCLFWVSRGHDLDALENEPACISRFDYDFKMLKKMVDIAKENEELRETVNNLKAKVEQITPDGEFFEIVDR